VAQSSWPSPTSSRTVTDLQYEQLVAPQYVDGLVGSPTDAALVSADGSGMHVFLAASRYGQVRGHAWTSGASTVTLTIGANSSGSTRTDLVVLGLDRSTWNATAYVKAGTPGSGAPALQTDTGDTGIFEIPLAEVTVLNGTSAISAGQVKTRHWYARPDGVASASTDTRPPSPTPGMRMWESGTAYVWNGSIWEKVSNPPTPVQSTQTTILSGLTGPSGIGDDSTWRGFSSAVWTPLTFVVPPTGRVYVTVSGWVENRATTSSSMWLSYFSTGGGMTSGLDPDVMDARAVSTRASRVVASNRKLYTGLTPGATVTLTPAYNSTTASSDANVSSIRYGNLIMEPA
jgi:hypothetical protein